ncbi:MAG: hypothetical protein WB626_03810 [Bacteroidota bacterium]
MKRMMLLLPAFAAGLGIGAETTYCSIAMTPLASAGGGEMERGGCIFSPPYPNPHNGHALVRYYLPVEMHVSLRLYDVPGREVALLADGVRGPGWEEVPVESTRLAGGMYWCGMQAGPYRAAKALVVLK